MKIQEYTPTFIGVLDDGTAATYHSLVSYGISQEVHNIVQSLKKQHIYLPNFERGYTWDIDKASRFIDTLIRDEPVPDFFVYRDKHNRYMVIDGYHRLETLRRFYSGRFDNNYPVFRLANLDDVLFKGMSYEELSDEVRSQLDEYRMHQVIFESAPVAASIDALYRIFARLNSGSLSMTADELRKVTQQNELIGPNTEIEQ